MSTVLDALLGAAAALLLPSTPALAPAPVALALDDAELLEQADALAHGELEEADETIVVISDAPAASASSVRLSADQLRFRSRTQPSDILRQVPGLVVSQHAGGGKSDQYFIRGFDADHGTDVAIFADGIPVNMTSHGHGQGYADTHWMIPETVRAVEMHKGPYAARFGDFYTAGALELTTIDQIEGPTVWIAAGGAVSGKRRFDHYDRRLVGMASPELRPGDTSLIALQIAETDGPFVNPQGFRQGNALGKWGGKVGSGKLELATTWYAGRWNQSGQLPEREIAEGRLARFGAIDPTEGGEASRASAQVAYRTRNAANGSSWRAMGYAVRNQLDLFSNFTLYARDANHGDQIEQTDDRMLYGLDTAYEKRLSRGGVDALVTVGAQLRADAIETSLWQTSKRERLELCFGQNRNPCNQTANEVYNAAAYVEATIVPVRWLQLVPAVRIDQLIWDVRDLDAETAREPMMTTSGAANAAIVSPKLTALIHADEYVSFFVNAGSGFHSNDARAAVASSGRGALARALGGELGIRMKPAAKARVSADVWYLGLASEQVWSGDLGGTSPSDPTRRFGLDLEGSVDAAPWLALDANVTWSRASFVNNASNGGALALAPRWMGSGGATAHARRGFVAVRARGIADRPGNDEATLTAQGYLLVDVIAGRKLGRMDVNLTINNALDTEWREAQFAEESRVTPTGELVEQMHFTPGAPLTATVTVACAW